MATSPVISVMSSVVGSLILLRCFWPLWRAHRAHAARALRVGRSNAERSADRVSIIVPARNEETNLAKLLDSLIELNWEDLELIVVDDESTDRTAQIALESSEALREHSSIRFRLIRGKPRPAGWTGKNWACHQGAEVATGAWLLFTDADTQHEKDSLCIAIRRMEAEDLDLLSAVPYHRCETWWEKLMGPFQLFLFVSTAAFSEPRPGRVFAIGQYLLFRKESYFRQGGHKQIRDTLCDDLELAHHCMSSRGSFRVEGSARLYRVRMYASFMDFIKGWRRIFRLGFRHARLLSVAEMYFVIAALTAGMKFAAASGAQIALMLACAGILASMQRRFGEFSVLGIVLMPFSLVLFVVISALAAWDLAVNREYSWRGRTYQGTAD